MISYLKIILLGIVIGLTSLVGNWYFLNTTYSRSDVNMYVASVAKELIKIKEKVFNCTIDEKTLECVKK